MRHCLSQSAIPWFQLTEIAYPLSYYFPRDNFQLSDDDSQIRCAWLFAVVSREKTCCHVNHLPCVDKLPVLSRYSCRNIANI